MTRPKDRTKDFVFNLDEGDFRYEGAQYTA